MRGIIWGLAISVVIWGVLICAICHAAATFEVVDGKAVITEVMTNQPVQYMGPNNQATTIPGTTRDITTKIGVTDTQAKEQIIRLNQAKVNTTKNYNAQMENINAQLKLLTDIDAAIPDEVVEPVE